MSAASDLRALLLASPLVTALVGQRVALGGVPQGTPYPFIVFTYTATPELNLDNSAGPTRHVFEVQAWAENGEIAIATGDAVALALFGTEYVVTSRNAGTDEELLLTFDAHAIELLD